ncbi:hypothetical protein BDP81DRAFT_191792 [Colletotrichum phormii]|uniref:Uncharacterized protein n=1 Tax=Colletotrichum phormii TaxID=359342 RepID=A0AAI9ZXK4_9PEZI|nr:uncharacterized protein BDP81DRAFT_191792 [Colletotrichum phormii]KAK1638808.1 hypothetical protein BDP81DRAFT_191792 [Colletotrichum phormii]
MQSSKALSGYRVRPADECSADRIAESWLTSRTLLGFGRSGLQGSDLHSLVKSLDIESPPGKKDTPQRPVVAICDPRPLPLLNQFPASSSLGRGVSPVTCVGLPSRRSDDRLNELQGCRCWPTTSGYSPSFGIAFRRTSPKILVHKRTASVMPFQRQQSSGMTVLVYPAICQMTQKSLSSDTGRPGTARLGFGSSPVCSRHFGEGQNGDCTATRLEGPGVLWQALTIFNAQQA